MWIGGTIAPVAASIACERLGGERLRLHGSWRDMLLVRQQEAVARHDLAALGATR